MQSDYSVSVIGLGYVGLTIAATYAKEGFTVVGVDSSEAVIAGLQNGTPHFHENGLSELLTEVSSHLTFTNTLDVHSSPTVFIVAVGTSLLSDGKPDFSQIDGAIDALACILKKNDLVILRSTVVVGTTRDRVVKRLEEKTNLTAGEDFYVGFAPERTIEGRALEELRTLPQVVAGYSSKCLNVTRDFFSVITPTVLDADTLEAAELVKLVSNAYRDVTFAFANSVALGASEQNIDAHQLVSLANYGYERNRIPLPSPGVGGYCLTKDPQLFAASIPGISEVHNFIISGRKINDSMPSLVVGTVKEFIAQKLTDKKVILGIVGLAFKSHPPTSDVRFSPSLSVIGELKNVDEIESVFAYDNLVDDSVFSTHNLRRCENLKEIFNKTDIVVFMHNSPYLQEPLVKELINSRLPGQLVIDTWGMYYDIHKSLTGHAYSSLTYKNF